MNKDHEKYVCGKINDICLSISKQPIRAGFWALGFLATIFFLLGLFNNSFFTAASVIIAAIVMLYGVYRNSLKDKQESSRFYLTKYIEGAEIVLARLKADSPERRIAWVSAASIAERLKSIEEKITEPPDKDFLEIYQRNFAHLLMEFILERPATYFYGIDDPKGATDIERLDDAAERAMENNGVALPGLTPKLKLFYIEEKQIAMILKLVDSIWIKEGGYACTNEYNLILNMLNWNYPNIYEYISHRNSCEEVFDKNRGYVFKRRRL